MLKGVINLIILLLISFLGYIFNIKELSIRTDYKWIFEFSKCFIIIILFLIGIFREKFKKLEVQYTRKTFHIITLLLLPFAALLTYKSRKSEIENENINLLYYSYYHCIWSSLFLNTSFLFLVKPIRKLDNFLGYISKVSFLCIDRPEDRPFTILWLILQISAVALIETPMTIWFLHIDKFHLFWIPIFSSGLGDGLAEIVGKKYGKHKYTAYALFTKKKYERSIEGSLCVYLFSIIGICIGYNYYDDIIKFVLTLFILPILVTIMEAISPHTWDNHFIFGIIWLFLWIIFDIF